MTRSSGPAFAGKHLLLSTFSFALCFAVWGLISAFAPHFRKQFDLSATSTAFLVAVPVLLGSLARIPVGMLADRFGGRAVFSVLMIAVSVPTFLVPIAASYRGMLLIAFLLGMAGSSFAVGVSYVSRWTPPKQQGTALGIYGLGNIGQSAAVFLGPVLAGFYGVDAIFQGSAILMLFWGVIFAATARNAPARAQPKGIGAMIAILR
jgi:NNP family nitrate/nitrite transporter-like MFS transporter